MSAFNETETLIERLNRQISFYGGEPQQRVSLMATLRQAERTLMNTSQTQDTEAVDAWIKLLKHYELGMTAMGQKQSYRNS